MSARASRLLPVVTTLVKDATITPGFWVPESDSPDHLVCLEKERCGEREAEALRPLSGVFSCMRLFAATGVLLKKNLHLCLTSLCYDSAPGGASLWPEKTPRAQRPVHPTKITLSGPNGLWLTGSAA